MTLRDLLAVFALGLVVAGLSAPIYFGDRSYLPRHPDAQDLPWAQAATRPEVLTPDAEPFNTAFSDKVNLLYPDTVYSLKEARAGRLPEWNPQILGGVPHAANPLTAIFYPPNWLLFLVAPPDAPLLSAATHLFLAAFFIFIFLRMAGLSVTSSLVGAFAFVFSGWVSGHLQNTPLVAVVTWLPLGLFAIEARMKGHSRWSLMLLSLAVAMMWIAGMPQLAVYCTLALGLYALIGIVLRVRRDGLPKASRHAGGILVFTVVGLLLSSVQLLPMLELMPHSGHHGHSPEELDVQRFRLGGFVGALFPRGMGDPTNASEDWTQQWGARLLMGEGPNVLPPAGMNWSERTIYPGIVVLLLAVLAALRPRGRPAIALMMIAAVGLCLATSSQIIAALSIVPGLDVGAPSRAVILPCFALSALAAFGFENLRQGAYRTAPRWALLILFVPLMLVCTWAYVSPDGVLTTVVEMLKESGMEQRFGANVDNSVESYVESFRGAYQAFRFDFLILTLLVGGSLFLLWLRTWKPGLSQLALVALAVLMVVDLLGHFIPVNLPVREAGLFRNTPSLQYLSDHLGEDRFMRVSSTEDAARAELHRLLPPNLGLLFGLNDAQGYREQVPVWYPRLWEGVAAATRSVGVAGIAADQADSPILDLARVRYLVAGTPIPSLETTRAFPKAGESSDLYIYENSNPLPKAYVVHEAACLPENEALKELREGRIDPCKKVVFHQWPSRDSKASYAVDGAPAKVVIRRNEPSSFSASVTSPAEGYLVITDTYFPCWKAFVTGSDSVRTEVPLVRAMGAFRACPIPAGVSTIDIEYRSSFLKYGVILTALGWIGFLLLPLIPASRRSAGDSSGRERHGLDQGQRGASSLTQRTFRPKTRPLERPVVLDGTAYDPEDDGEVS